MSGLNMNLVVIMALMLASVQFHGTAAQTTHVVGNALGWNIPPNGPSAYTTWASTQTFRVGDVLLFNFITGFHNVVEVPQAAYGSCTTANPTSISTTGPARVTLNAPGTHYYICTSWNSLSNWSETHHQCLRYLCHPFINSNTRHSRTGFSTHT
ncbi:hypothetical protein Lser_V15G29017 [Lactuca serriola]